VNETAEVIEQTQSQETQPQETPVAFADSLGEEFKGNPIFKNFQDVNGLAKSYMHAQRMIGADKVAIPGKHATDAERLEVYQKLGAPVNIDGYEVKFPETFTADEQKAFKETALSVGLNGNQASKVVDFLSETFNQASAQSQLNADQVVADNRAELQKEWGNALDQKLERARGAAVHLLGSDDIFGDIQLKDGTHLGDNPQIIRMFAALADQISEDTLGGPTSEQISTPEELEREKRELMQSGSPYWSNTHPDHDKYIQRVLKINEDLYPEPEG
tara:strand:+ start:362 stop:1183 length:822 start_codon:yes stop_codon:yes gene_type:complete